MGTNKRYPSHEPSAAKTPPAWHPSAAALPVEWEIRNGWPPNPMAIIRRVERQNGNVPIVRYRAVTWSPRSEARELIGYYETGDDAARAGWEHFHGRHAWCQHD